jgi:hypothetical protein
MTHGEHIQCIYNGLSKKYQCDIAAMLQNRVEKTVRAYRLQRMNEHLAHQLDVLAGFAHDLEQHVLAEKILRSAVELSSEGIPPKQM